VAGVPTRHFWRFPLTKIALMTISFFALHVSVGADNNR
jgi:hypothetical protein